ncbi:fish-egg lectin-like [Poeciliopsis prolifica]|uniref:fish-egg lectin-like n=1 Tax=Poeciliopsis prolifica TaxID=188132 RepID=UPI0024140D46|nr:fish-egg lectin-like [Poeciliopsis prolifica]
MKTLATFLVLLNYFTRCHGWICTTAPSHQAASQVDAGNGMVVMTDKNSNSFFLSDSSWSKLGSVPLKHVSVGSAGVWGVDRDNKVYKFSAGDFFPTHGQVLIQVDAGDGKVVGVTSQNTIHCLDANSAAAIEEEGNLNWRTIPGLLMYFSCGPVGCWGVNSGQDIFFTKASPDSCSLGGWNRIDGAAVKVEVGSDGRVFVVNQSGNVYERTGISEAAPQGTGWTQISFCVSIKHVTYDLGRLWLLTDAGVILNCI